MFRMLKLSPPHGWASVWWELAIVTLGVLIALVAQQAVEGMQLRADERALRETINHEIGLNLFAYKARSRQSRCVEEHLAALGSWLVRSRSGEAVPTLLPAGPSVFAPYRSAWENRDAEVFNALPRELRQKYAEFYDELSNNWDLMQDEADYWARLNAYAEPGPLSLQDRRVLRSTLAAIDRVNDSLAGNLPISEKIAAVLKVREVQPDNMPANWLEELDRCGPITAPQAI